MSKQRPTVLERARVVGELGGLVADLGPGGVELVRELGVAFFEQLHSLLEVFVLFAQQLGALHIVDDFLESGGGEGRGG